MEKQGVWMEIETWNESQPCVHLPFLYLSANHTYRRRSSGTLFHMAHSFTQATPAHLYICLSDNPRHRFMSNGVANQVRDLCGPSLHPLTRSSRPTVRDIANSNRKSTTKTLLQAQFRPSSDLSLLSANTIPITLVVHLSHPAQTSKTPKAQRSAGSQGSNAPRKQQTLAKTWVTLLFEHLARIEQRRCSKPNLDSNVV